MRTTTPLGGEAGECPSAATHSEEGSEVVSYVFIQTLVLIVVLCLIQLAFALHTRNIMISAAGEGARRAALAGGDPTTGEARTRELLSAGLGMSEQQAVRVEVIEEGGAQMTVVTIEASLPVIATWGPARSLTVKGRALMEDNSAFKP